MPVSTSLKHLKIASRESALALWQSRYIKSQLEKLYPQLSVEVIGMTTQGDKILDVPLAKIGGKGLFVKELESSMLEGHTDIAVHSMKDVPMDFPAGLELSVICERADPFDAFVSNHYDKVAQLPEGATVGTSSLRRQSQLAAFRPDLKILPLRGNVNTRLAKLDAGDFDAIILAASGLKRLGFDARIKSRLSSVESLPAVGQGALGIECRSTDVEIKQLLSPLIHQDSETCVKAERAMNHRLQGGCQVPIAGYATLDGGQITLEGLVASIDGKTILRTLVTGPIDEPEILGEKAAEHLLAQGAKALLSAINNTQ